MTFTVDECYLLFLAMDDFARLHEGSHKGANAIRERMLPIYAGWHADNPHKIHPSTSTAYEPGKP
jgi:hypothetical protein